jgi:hypothetical protein
MIRKFCTLMLVIAFAAAITGCQENEREVTHKSEKTTETTPRDSDPGTMIVE